VQHSRVQFIYSIVAQFYSSTDKCKNLLQQQASTATTGREPIIRQCWLCGRRSVDANYQLVQII